MAENHTKEPTREERLNRALNEMVDRYEALETENAGLRRQLDALTNQDGAIAVLRAIAHAPDTPLELKVKAASALAPYERPKLALQAKTNVVRLFDTLDRAHQRDRELRAAAAKVIEGKVIEPAGTILGDDPAA
jgi:hypothetical protein